MPDNEMTLIIDENPYSAKLIKEVVSSLGIRPIKIISDIERAKASVLTEHLGLIIMDTRLGRDSTLDLVNWLRKTNNQNKTIPIVLLTSSATKELVTSARDIGITEFLLKPFTSAILSSTILSVMKQPRNFIISRSYSGPDRRRKKTPPPDGEEKRNIFKKQNKVHDD